MKLLATIGLSAVVLGVSAQNITLIPTNITSSCTTFLTSLNSDLTLQSCIGQLINITSAFTPTPSGSPNVSQSDINFALAAMCNDKAKCQDNVIRGWLSQFWSTCNVELTSSGQSNSQVRDLYDLLYAFNPMVAAVCAIDSANQEYCINEIKQSSSSSSSASSSAPSASSTGTDDVVTGISNNTLLATVTTIDAVELARQYLIIPLTSTSITKRLLSLSLFKNRDSAQVVEAATLIAPNTTTYRNTMLPFLFLQPDMKAAQLCTPCAREVMVSYVKFEAAYPYTMGLASSAILGGQPKLWNAINGTCGPNFIAAIMSQVGLSSSLATNGNGSASAAGRRLEGLNGGLVSVLGGVVGIVGLLGGLMVL
ncbi:hypothetical protein TREMEDRAFT_41126 [Tremella mesenterica DSM 1558]|uniref:uncharacterized protein n=1 Tax=Tremella mesenterica (strain ATCC 24925 / CBS 8224 / DSM 1558 / NBRC 9311 / NRRL Y-6157 / RJB 2259-6 / UBC 559-6) TaxID=578456 RepID=UPI00032D65E3|nr:uncharacterized protein TREMEDRAFT_41126 [Tremella mesenterica DSM 1558]EIW66090.1 hypothetical protein TREMEDRAFT_41126 [Tremella mesenterica DSM 1558]